ncbi:cellulose synthase subunit BcsC-related outer membrane protein [Novispirillum itersonii]|uniref:cellulose synthase subunit BcsC-related outer membrane protein n=1 Tax=Novispirillum itersonii TaxID=189 RepID=UPI000377A822|nr:cellulose synthase subunit BcsC-related outer membrane protein [Novispirillum itersonii]
MTRTVLLLSVAVLLSAAPAGAEPLPDLGETLGDLGQSLGTLAGRSDWQAGTGAERRSTNGTHGEGSLHITVERAYAEGMVDDWRLTLMVVRAEINTGFAAGAIGRRPGGGERSSPLAEADVVFPTLTLRQESDDWTTLLRVGTTPLGGAVSARLSGRAELTHYGDDVILGGKVFAEPVVSSMLSYTGMRDPVSGDSWGRVMDMGGGAQAIWLPWPQVGVGLSGEAAALQGEDVKDNTRVSARLDLSYDLKPDGFDHLRVGPFASYARFAHNLSHYTWGHGGYYSPSQDLRQGLALDALTTEGQRWQVEARASVALAQAEEDAAPRFWLGDDAGGQYDASRTDGVNGQVSLRASALLGDHLILSGFSRYQAAPQYTDVAIGAFLTIPFSARGGVFSADLPDSVFTPFR